MKRRTLKTLIVVALVAVMLVPGVSFSASDTNAKSGSVSVPVSTGLTGSGNAAKSFLLDLPSGVSASSIRQSSLKYSGNNDLIDSITIENGKIKLKLKGNDKTESYPVKGTNGSIIKDFTTNPGNSIWRYADGRRWQINEYDENKKVNRSYNLNASDSNTPSEKPPMRIVTTKSMTADPSTASWYKDESTKVPYSSVDPNSIEIIASPAYGGSVTIKDGQFNVTHVIPNSYIPEEVPDSFEKGPWVTGRLYYTKVNYYMIGMAKVTSYSYAGKVTFDYTLPTEPTLTGEVQLLKPNPNPTKATGSDIPVTISLKGELAAYTDKANIQEWVFYAKETGNDSTLQTKKDFSKVLSSSQTFDFKIPKAKTTAVSFTQEYTLTVVVRFSKPIITAGEPISSLPLTFTVRAGTYTGPPPSNLPEPTTPPVTGKPPIARITMPDQVVAGEKFTVSGGESYDPDGTIVKYNWQHPNIEEALYGKSSETRYGLDDIDTTQTITLTVVDNDGLTGTTSRDIKIVAPAPKASLRLLGTLKQNRKITLQNVTKNVSDDFPMIPEKTRFTVSAVSGGTNADIKYSGSLIGVNEADILIRTPGQYKATLYVENTAGYSGTTSWTFTVAPDEAPDPHIYVVPEAYRDPANGNKATIVLEDFSVSPDYDYLAKRVWQYRYDSDNDGNYEEEAWVTLSSGNEDRITFQPSQVGRYEIRLTVTEEFGQPTIDQFVTAADRRSANTDSQPLTERIVTINNRPPTSDWDL